MFNFALKKAAIFQAVKLEGYSVFKIVKVFKKLFLVLFIVSSVIFLYGFIPARFSQETSTKLLGVSIVFLILFFASWIKGAFLNSKLKRPKIKIRISEVLRNPEGYNLAGFLSFEVARAVWKSIKFAKSKKIPEIGSSALFYFLVSENPKLDFVFSRAAINLKDVKGILKAHLKLYESHPRDEVGLFSGDIGYSKDFQKTILESLRVAQEKGHQGIEIGDIITALAKCDLVFKKVLIDSKLTAEDIGKLACWQESWEEKIEKGKRFWDYENLLKQGTLAKEWASGYTITLDKYSIDWTEIIKEQKFPEIVGHTKELKQSQRILSRREINNVLLIGEPGTGRRSIVYSLACKSLLGQSLPSVNYKRIVELDLPTMLSQLESVDEVETILGKIFQEIVSAGNIILVIDEFHNFVGGKNRPGVIDISGVLSSYLHLSQFQIIAITTFTGLHKHIEQRPSILNLFEKVEVSEISEEETLTLLENLTPILEKKYKRFITYQALKEIISLTGRYLSSLSFPKKAMDILDEAVIYVAHSTKDKFVMPSHVAKIITEKTQIPAGEVEVKEKEVLLNLEKLIHKRIINQEEAVQEVSTALRRARAAVTIRRGPMGAFLFLGPTGVGKTETCKALAEIYFGSEQKIIRIDMSEFQNVQDISRLIGSSGREGLLTTPVLGNPFSLILLDEIEKAHPNILNLFLQVFDEGHLTDGSGKKVDFKNSIIITTSNAGYKVILEALAQETEWSQVKNKLLGFLFKEGIFRPEFINRFDAVVVFKPLTKENLLGIAELFLQELKKNLKEKEIEFIITSSLKEKIVELGYSPTFGAREMKRVIQSKVENVLASALLGEKLKRGDKVEVEPEKFELIIH